MFDWFCLYLFVGTCVRIYLHSVINPGPTALRRAGAQAAAEAKAVRCPGQNEERIVSDALGFSGISRGFPDGLSCGFVSFEWNLIAVRRGGFLI